MTLILNTALNSNQDGRSGAANAHRVRRRHALFTALVSCLFVLSARTAPAQPVLRVPRAPSPPALEDYLDGRSRPDEVAVTGFVQREPGDGVPVSQPTTAYLSYDDDHLYIVFVCRDSSPEAIRARLTRREAILGDDLVGVILDTFHDRRRGYLFLVNPLGIQLDGLTAEGQDDDYSFDTLWRSEGRLTADGYVVRMAIPFKSLRFPDRPRQVWGIALGRIIPRANETSFWPYVTQRIAGLAQQFATLEGIEGISPGRNAQIIPYGAFTGARFLDTERPAFDTDATARGGLDVKMIIQDAFALDLALNPDFSQVESDEPQVTINQRFEVFFPEKRPFFLENATIFETPVPLFFSRRVADPQIGGRVTGKANGWTLGAVAIDDRAQGRALDSGDAAFGDRAGIGVVRAQRDVGSQSNVGLLATSRDFGSSANRVLSADARVKLNANWVAQGQAIVSDTRLLDGRSLSGPAYFAGLFRPGRRVGYNAQYRDIAPGFRAPLGFVPRVGIRQFDQFARYAWRPKESPLLSYGPQVFGRTTWDHAGVRQDWFLVPSFQFELRGQTRLGISREVSRERLGASDFRKGNLEMFFRTERVKWLTVFAAYNRGRSINFFPAEGLQPFLGDSRFATLQLTTRPTSQLRIDQTYIFSGLARPGDGATIFNNHILRSRINYQFTRELSLRGIVDYTAVLANSSLVALQRRKGLSTDVLLTYLLNPGTALYIGYNDRYQNVQIDPAGTGIQLTGSPFHATGRQLFVKASYLFRF